MFTFLMQCLFLIREYKDVQTIKSFVNLLCTIYKIACLILLIFIPHIIVRLAFNKLSNRRYYLPPQNPSQL